MTVNNSKSLDSINRPLRDLRISVTDRCNFRCRYCMPEEIFDKNFQFMPNEKLLSFDEITRLARIFASLGIEKIRLSGGEPLLRKDLPKLIRVLNEIDGISDIALTTNGSLLSHFAKDLKEAGLKRINVSLDSLDNETFRRMNGGRCDVGTVLEGIEAAANIGMEIKVNMVVQKGVNDQDILPMARYFRNTGHVLRFIEFMDVGNSNGWDLRHVVSKREIIDLLNDEMPIEPVPPKYFGEVASRFYYRGTNKEIGIISSVTESFCSSCTRARLSANGHLYTCLFATNGTDLQGLIRSGTRDEELRLFIQEVWGSRFDRYSDERFYATNIPKHQKIEMHYIGG
ncbi:GTP 3',8-cyclase MoaA [Neobacillus niacini]|uniref:GTP 3',8-cyclase MoaA n=1 Tax=Neobacillus niacini TaxID=86668 RepID=UPI0009E0138F|nr:GTP 3',8-cyclase MoaA [Neobacillus niacini]